MVLQQVKKTNKQNIQDVPLVSQPETQLACGLLERDRPLISLGGDNYDS